ncbi:hypothetical protein ATCC90586_010329 [Pythium insidiosum]|nr:hypothetical protein ATCC90586_010329 [Pythium insidiosum]
MVAPAAVEKDAEMLDWTTRLVQYHAAELQADMYAEYIAIGASMAVYFIFHDHPQYDILGGVDSAASAVLSMDAITACLVQILVEIIVDFVCCLFELSGNIPFRVSRDSTALLTTLFTSCALMAVGLSSAMYLHNTEGS